jgi:riboflavin synthase
MFTGIIETVGVIRSVGETGDARVLHVDAGALAGGLRAGDSVAVDGVCLTVEAADAAGFRATAVAETLARTTLGGRRTGDGVNLERAATMDRLFGGHIVQGHVDGVGRVVSWETGDAGGTLVVEVPEDVYALCVYKGSIAIDGVSLTVAAKDARCRIRIAIVPHTVANTTMSSYLSGRAVNLEADVVAKYVHEFVKRFEPAGSE